MVNGWQINDIMSVYSGTHFTVQSSAINSNVVNLRSDRPDWRPQASFTQSLNQWFDTTAFRLQTFGHAGNEGRNKFTMPGAFRTDLSVFKDFRVTESVKVQFRAEMFNLTNHPSFGKPGTTIRLTAAGFLRRPGILAELLRAGCTRHATSSLPCGCSSSSNGEGQAACQA